MLSKEELTRGNEQRHKTWSANSVVSTWRLCIYSRNRVNAFLKTFSLTVSVYGFYHRAGLESKPSPGSKICHNHVIHLVILMPAYVVRHRLPHPLFHVGQYLFSKLENQLFFPPTKVVKKKL